MFKALLVCLVLTATWWTDRSTDVPEPSSMALIGAALLALGASRRRKAAVCINSVQER